MKTYITYNKGRDWRLLQAPDMDLRGNPVHCLLVSVLVSCETTGQTAYLGMLHQRPYSTKEALGMFLVLGRDFLQLLGYGSVDSDCHIIWMESSVGFHKLLLENILCATTSSKRKTHKRKPVPKGPRQSSVVINTY